MSTKKDLIDQDDELNPFEDDFLASPATIGVEAFEPELQAEPLQPTKTAPVATPNNASVFARLSPYFQIDAKTLQLKIVTALRLGELSSLREAESQNDVQLDLYSTVWITATVVLVAFLSYSGKNVLRSIITGTLKNVTKFGTMVNCFLLFYCYVIGMPLAVYLVSRFVFKEQFNPIVAIDSYGVSNVVWIPVGFFGVLTGALGLGSGHHFVEWILAVLGGTYSGLIIYIQLKNMLAEMQNGKVLLCGMVALHVGFTVLVKVLVL